MDYNQLKTIYNCFLKTNNLKPSNVVLSAGAAMMVHGLRDSITDIDVDVSKLIHQRFNGCLGFNLNDGRRVHILPNKMELHEKNPNMDVVEIDGFVVYSLESLLIQKIELKVILKNRPKDIEDIKKIQEKLLEEKYSFLVK